MACVILRVQTIVLMLSRLYNSNLSAALTRQLSKVNRTSLERVLVSLMYIARCYFGARIKEAFPLHGIALESFLIAG